MKYRGILLIIFVMILALLLVGCLRSADGADDSKINSANEEPDATPTELTTEQPSEPVTEEPTDAPVTGPMFPLGIYVADGGEYRNLGEYVSAWPKTNSDSMWIADTWTYPGRTNLICDVAYFGVFPFDDDRHDFVDYKSEYMALWRAAGLDGYKIGLEFDVELSDGSVKRGTVLSARDTFMFEEYFEIYLYDDVAHAYDSWYSHITESATNDQTLVTTFKITLRSGCYDVESIAVTAFVYKDSSEFDADGFYTGVERTTAVIGRSN